MARQTKVPGEQTPPETIEQNTNIDQDAGQTVQAQLDQPSNTTTTNPVQPPSELDTSQLGETGEQTPPDWALKILAGQARIEAKLRSMSLPQQVNAQPLSVAIIASDSQVLTEEGWGRKE